MKWLIAVLLLLPTLTWAAAPASGKSKVKYKQGKDLNFDETVIEGQLKRPELSVVTGDSSEDSGGLLRLREDFTDRVKADAGQETP